MRCSNCNKFVSEENGDPEVEDIDIELDEPTPESKEFNCTLTATVRIVRLCAECSEELREYRFEFNETIEIPIKHHGHDFEVNETACESSEKDEGKTKYVGAELSYEILCNTCQESLDSDTLKDSINPKDMDELA